MEQTWFNSQSNENQKYFQMKFLSQFDAESFKENATSDSCTRNMIYIQVKMLHS